MTNRILALALPALLVAGCGDNSKGTGTTTAASAPVAGKAAPAGQSWTDTVVKTADYGYRMGNPDAPIKLVEYGSRACPFCAQFEAEGFPLLKAQYIASGKVSYEFRDYPIHGALDIAPILLGHCVDDSAFFPLLEAMMANQQTLLAKEQEVAQKVQGMQGASPQTIATTFAQDLGYLDFVKQRGVPDAKARACLADSGQLDALTKATAKANADHNVTSTPTFLINNEPVALEPTGGAWPQLEQALKRAGG